MLAASFTMLRCTISNTSLIFDSNATQILNHSQIAAVAIFVLIVTLLPISANPASDRNTVYLM